MTDRPTGDDHYQKMVDRVAKLLRQAADAERARRDAEKIAFQEKAFAIMANYGIDEVLARARQEGLDVRVDPKAASAYISLTGGYQPAQAVVLFEMADAMQCTAVQFTPPAGRRGISFRVYGMPEHLCRLQDMWGLIAPQIQYGLAHACPVGSWANPAETRAYRHHWLLGFGEEVANRIRSAERAAAAAAGAVELYRSDRSRAESAMNDDYPHLRENDYDPYDRYHVGWQGYDHGQRDGKGARLHWSLEE
jgi:hypothetical protein